MKNINKTKLRKDIMNHFKMISRLYSAGVPLIESLYVFYDKNILDWKFFLLENLRLGKTFGQSIEDMSLPIKGYELTIIKKSENTGNLSDGLRRVYEMDKKIQKTKSKMIIAMLYPVIISIVSLTLILLILLLIVPKIKPLFNGSKISIPWSTKLLFFLSAYLTKILLILLLVFFAFSLALYLIAKRKSPDYIKSVLYGFVIKLPVLGSLINHYSALISFRIASEVFSSSGLLVESLRDSASGSIIPRERVKLLNIADEVESGIPLSKSISREVTRETKIWVPLIVCGEQTGTISETFSSIADIHQEYFDESVALINKLIEPISMIFVGVIVGFIAVSIITPIYSLISFTGY